jgi:hypothetical protein
MSQAPTASAPDGATDAHAPRRAWFARLAPHATVLLTVIGVALIWAGATANTARERVRDEQAAIQSANNLARAFEEQVIGLLRAADQVLLYVRGNFERNAGQIDPSLWSRPFDALSDFSFQIAVIGRDGILAASSIESPDIVSLLDRDHFLVHANRATDELYISRPLIGRVSGRRSIQLTRRITAPDGSFGGVMVLSIDPDYFTRFYKTIDLGKNGSVSLVGTDGFVRAHGVN